MNNQCVGAGAALSERQPSAHFILEQLNNLASRSEDLAIGLESRLAQISRPGEPIERPNKAQPERVMPPYFQELNTAIEHINRQLNSIADTISRVDL